MNKIKWLAGFIGAGIVVYLVHSIGWAEIFRNLFALGWMAPSIFLTYFLTNYINTWAWFCVFPPSVSKNRVSISQMYVIRICGEFVNNFTPTAHVGGDIIRALCLQKLKVPSTVGVVSVIMDKAALIITQILFIYTGLVLFLMEVDWPASRKMLIGSSLVLALLAIYGIVASVRKGFFSEISNAISRKWHWQAIQKLHDKVKRLDMHLIQFYRNHHKEFLKSNYLHYAGWVVGSLETWTILYLLGKTIGILDAIMIESLMTLAKGLGFLIPGSLGVLEGGSVLLFQALGLGPGLGLAFSLLKRAREIFFGILGWVALSTQFNSMKLSKLQS